MIQHSGFLNPYPFCRHCQGRGCDRCEESHLEDHRRAFPDSPLVPQPLEEALDAPVEL